MSIHTDKAAEVSQTILSRPSFVPFTGGLIFFLYAFFWPEQYGHWLGTIVRSFRSTAGL